MPKPSRQPVIAKVFDQPSSMMVRSRNSGKFQEAREVRAVENQMAVDLVRQDRDLLGCLSSPCASLSISSRATTPPVGLAGS